MQKQRYLLDEVRASEPIKNTLRLTWELIVLNKKFTLIVLSLLLLLNILTFFSGLFGMVLSGIFALTIQIYLSQMVYFSEDIEEFIEQIKSSKVEVAVANNAFVASGAYIAWLILFVVFIFVLALILKNSGIPLEDIKTINELISATQILFLPTVILTLLISYIYPLVQSNIALAQNIFEGFLAPFTIFSPALWRASFKNEYLKYIVMIMGLTFLGALLFGIFISLPIINIVAGFIFIVAVYVYMVFNSIVAMVARRIVES